MPIRPPCLLPLRPSVPPSPSRIALLQPISHQHFHTTTSTRSDDHYSTLDLPTTATAAEIKKQFYKLSKANHPDLHPNDSTASQRFVKISEAYAVLGSPEKRARYDRDFLRANPQASAGAGGDGGRRGSYSSASSPAGGRPASGLSRRRTQFRGPPPSFYRSGGWGAQSEKRSEHASRASHAHEAAGSSAAGAGMGPGGFATGSDSDVSHFDHKGHYQTHSEIERTRHRARRKRSIDAIRLEEEAAERSGMGMGLGFLVISGILALGIALPGMMMTGRSGSARREKE